MFGTPVEKYVTYSYLRDGMFEMKIEPEKKNFEEPDPYRPVNIIYREEDRVTVVEWEDGIKTVVKASKEDKFIPEFGVAMALCKKMFGSRAEFMRIVNGGKFQKSQPKKEKIVKESKVDEQVMNQPKYTEVTFIDPWGRSTVYKVQEDNEGNI